MRRGVVRHRRKTLLLGGSTPDATQSTLTADAGTMTANGTDNITYTYTPKDSGGATLTTQAWTATVARVLLSAGNSTVTLSTSTIADDGVESCNIAVYVEDADGNPAPNVAVVIAVSGAGNTVTQPASRTNAFGVATGSVVSTTAAAKTVSATINSLAVTQTQTLTVSGDAGEITPGGSDTIWYDDNFTDTATWAARRTKYNTLVTAGVPAAIFEAPADSADAEVTPTMVAPGYSGSSYAIEIDVASGFPWGDEVRANFPVRLVAGQTVMAATDTLFVDMWLKVEWEFTNLLWVKGMEMFHAGGGSGASGDRTQYGFYRTGATQGFANINPQSQVEIHMHQEDGAADAPTLYQRWADINGAGYLRHTFVFKKSTTTGTTRDGIARYYIEGEKIIDASQFGLDNGWMEDRQSGVDAASTSPYPGNVGEKYSSTTGDAALLLLADEAVTSLIWPGIIGVYSQGTGAGKFTIGRIRCWTRPV